MPLIPLMIDISKKKVFVIGGGNVAERRVNTLVNYAKDIHIISPNITEKLKDLVRCSVIKWSEKSFEINDIHQADFIVVATDSASTNQWVLQHKPSHAMINMAGAATSGDVVFPSILRRGKLTLSVSTNGASPALTAQILAEFQQKFTSRYEVYVDFLYECRQRVKKSSLSSLEKQRFLKSILADRYLEKDKQRDVVKWLDSLD
ncbi:NAD(P)-binding protein [Staphylococcus sp. NAM3COL9]|uniref:NAD(P)-binding protein n=1 Tax=Staphylococcus sp. NAM3COL9 TaxID=1667172 RepID=UPI0007108B0D|nr:NAD(P)-binding protein [Staphylococcus sp. NAM3COL9]KRG11187.1 precorrin-2 dehydrogenase [Staphylococcus sp. NAM3COL9]